MSTMRAGVSRPVTLDEVRTQYLALSAAEDFRVTQVVDGTKGVHAMIPKSLFRKKE